MVYLKHIIEQLMTQSRSV